MDKINETFGYTNTIAVPVSYTHLPILSGEYTVRRHRVHHLRLIWVDDGQSQPGMHGLNQKVLRDQLAVCLLYTSAVFEVIRSSIAAKGGVPVKKGKLIVATVQGLSLIHI